MISVLPADSVRRAFSLSDIASRRWKIFNSVKRDELLAHELDELFAEDEHPHLDPAACPLARSSGPVPGRGTPCDNVSSLDMQLAEQAAAEGFFGNLFDDE